MAEVHTAACSHTYLERSARQKKVALRLGAHVGGAGGEGGEGGVGGGKGGGAGGGQVTESAGNSQMAGQALLQSLAVHLRQWDQGSAYNS